MPLIWKPTAELLIAQTKPDEKKGEAVTASSIADFRLPTEQLNKFKERFGIAAFDKGHARQILEKIHHNLMTKDAPDLTKKTNIIYEENKGLVREPIKVLIEGKADCDEVTRTAYLLAWENGVKNILMVEMKWTDPKTNEQTGHSFIVLMPQNKSEQPLIYDFTYGYHGVQLEVGNDLEAAIRKKYASDSTNPNFRIAQRKNLDEVEAAHYEFVGKYYAKQDRKDDWKKSEEAYGRAVRLAPTEFEHNWGLGVAYEKQFRWKEALEVYKRCAKFEEGKNNPRVFGAFGSAYAATGDITEAKKLLIRALELNPEKELRTEIENNLRAITK